MADTLPTKTRSVPPDALDHASEFVRIVMERTPPLYEEMIRLPGIVRRLSGDKPFNHGKLYAWAEFLVFRAEFLQRFPQAGNSACINAFSSLFLKNDISISNLVEAMEPAFGEELARLTRQPGPN